MCKYPKEVIQERVAVIPCFQGEECWCRMLVWESYLMDKRFKSKIIINYGNVSKREAEHIAEIINAAYDVLHGKE